MRWLVYGSVVLPADSEDADEARQMTTLTCVCAGCTSHNAGFVKRPLNLIIIVFRLYSLCMETFKFVCDVFHNILFS